MDHRIDLAAGGAAAAWIIRSFEPTEGGGEPDVGNRGGTSTLLFRGGHLLESSAVTPFGSELIVLEGAAEAAWKWVSQCPTNTREAGN